jgi:hypothetical protein
VNYRVVDADQAKGVDAAEVELTPRSRLAALNALVADEHEQGSAGGVPGEYEVLSPAGEDTAADGAAGSGGIAPV